MPTGYENEPDYAGPMPTRRGTVGIALIVAALVVLLAWLRDHGRLTTGSIFPISS